MSIQPAIDLLKQMRALHEEMIVLSERKVAILIANQTDELMKLTRKENKIIKQIQETDHVRRLWIAHYLQSKDFPVQYTITISEFSKYVFHPDEKKALLEEQVLLSDALNKLKELIDSNQKLIQEALKYINFSLDLFTLSGDEIVYQNPAQPTNNFGRSSIFDSKA
jgi:hypothetical protein